MIRLPKDKREIYDKVIFRVETNCIDSTSMSCEFSDILSLDDISDHNYFVTTASNEFGVVFIDIKPIDIVIMQVFVVFYY